MSRIDSEIALHRHAPPELHPWIGAILDAIAEDEVASSAWPEGEDFAKAASPAAIGRILIRTFHPGLDGRPIGWLWKENLTVRGAIALATASKTSGKLKYFAGKDFLVVVNHTTWRDLDLAARIALLDHELCHCALDPETDAPLIVPHDIEEFDRIVKRWGLWDRRLERFGQVIRDLGQGSLFDAPPEAEGADSVIPMGDSISSVTLSSGGKSVTMKNPKHRPTS